MVCVCVCADQSGCYWQVFLSFGRVYCLSQNSWLILGGRIAWIFKNHIRKKSDNLVDVYATVTEDKEADEAQKDVPDESFTVPSDITGVLRKIVIIQ